MAVEVLVTGAAGVVGREVVRRLRSACHKVWACTRTPQEGSDCVWDVLQHESPTPECRPSTVIHCAARIGRLNEPYSETLAHFEVNVMGTLRVAAWCVSHGVRRLIVTSSAIVYGEWTDRPKSESDCVSPWAAGPYAVSKSCSEHVAEMMRHAGGELTILRLSSLYGAEYAGSLVFRLLREGIDTGRIGVYTPLSSFDLLHLSDAADTVVKAVFASKSCLWNVGGGELTTVLTLAEACAGQVGAEVVVSEGSPSQAGRIINWVDDSKARTDLGHCNRIALELGVSEVVQRLSESHSST